MKINKCDFLDVKHYKVKIVKQKDKPLKFIISVISYALFIWLLLIGVTLLIYVADIKIREFKGDTSPSKFNAYVVLTGSMLPGIKVNDVVVTKRVDPSTLIKGDVITFISSDNRFNGITVTHRVVETYYDSTTGKYTFQSKGDANNVVDTALVQSDNILGKVIFRIPKLGYLQEFLASRGGWIIVILIPCLTILSYDIMKLFKTINKKNKDKKLGYDLNEKK